MKVPVYKGKSKEIQTFIRFLSGDGKLAINATNRKPINSWMIKLLKIFHIKGIEFSVNQSCIQCSLMDSNLFDIVNVNEQTFQIIVKTCHISQLPTIDFAIDGEPTQGYNSKTSRITVLLPTTDIGFAILIENIMSFIYRLPWKYQRI
jgi:hypothetical protein